MIRVSPSPEPSHFDSLVRQPGNGYYRRTSKFKNFWTRISKDLHEAYKGVCAYSCMYVIQPGSVDHFLPKSKYQSKAYEWSNYRFCSPRLNQHKGDSEDVIDPFVIQPQWFCIDFPSCLIKPGEHLTHAVKEQVENTIRILKLNADDILVEERCELMILLKDGLITIDFLRLRYPFLAEEVERQGILNSLDKIFKTRNV